MAVKMDHKKGGRRVAEAEIKPPHAGTLQLGRKGERR
jgi:hypothetical protein